MDTTGTPGFPDIGATVDGFGRALFFDEWLDSRTLVVSKPSALLDPLSVIFEVLNKTPSLRSAAGFEVPVSDRLASIWLPTSTWSVDGPDADVTLDWPMTMDVDPEPVEGQFILVDAVRESDLTSLNWDDNQTLSGDVDDVIPLGSPQSVKYELGATTVMTTWGAVYPAFEIPSTQIV